MTRRNALSGRALPAVGAVLAAAFLIAGCGSEYWEDDYYRPSPYPRYHDVTIILNVSGLDGRALGDVNVWVDGVLQRERTAWEFVRLGTGYPESWRGFRANWIRGGFTVATYHHGDVATIEVAVGRPGYDAQATRFNIDAAQPREVYARDTFILEPALYPAAAEEREPQMKPEPGEVMGHKEDVGATREEGGFRVTLRPEAWADLRRSSG